MNLYGAAFAIFISIFSLFPTTIPVTAENMNWAGPILLGLILIAMLDWMLRGKHVFKGPLRQMLDNEVDISNTDRRNTWAED